MRAVDLWRCTSTPAPASPTAAVRPGRGSGGNTETDARGPMGPDALTTYKWIGYGDDLVRNKAALRS